ncbi:AP-3 complex subunit mu-1 [Amphibalanus amphitrite]|uniref:AP-3 complex subunit mu-1 n=1 Tax=Amphibalanus amphitrite TaxID=1232801 RepID=A0A6A4WGB9_AMPAM|nr:AP-3 complex subunit mu-1 [Amphibalanus amphitrite]
MIHSLFIINHGGDVFLEKHWKSVIHRSVCDYFFDAQSRADDPVDVPPVITTPHHYLISVYRAGLYFVSVCTSEMMPLFVIEFLHRVVDTFKDYFGDCTESLIKEHYVLSNVPWRRSAVKYTNNEAYFDVVEEVDAIIDRSGSTVFAEIQGYIDCSVKLSGMPDLTMTFINPRLFDDFSFHPCVRFKRWESERLLSFIPPDGSFRLMSYHIGTQSVVAVPLYVRHNISFKTGPGTGRLDLTVGPKQTMGRTVENVLLEINMPKQVLNCMLTPSQGRVTFDPVSRLLSWTVGRVEQSKLPNLRGSLSLQTGAPPPDANPAINLQFTISQLAVSGVKVNRLDMYGEKYKPFKGVKYITRAGRFQVRT